MADYPKGDKTSSDAKKQPDWHGEVRLKLRRALELRMAAASLEGEAKAIKGLLDDGVLK
jgi:hypothetical protein